MCSSCFAFYTKTKSSAFITIPESARLAWAEYHPEVALVDLELGGEPGSALLLETWVRDLQTAVVVLTGSDDVDVANDSFEHGASGYVVKPFTPNELLMQVSNALRRRHLESAAADHVRELEHKVVEGATGISDLRNRLEQVTSDPEFDGFPMFSPDGSKLVWASGRSAKQGELNLFLADWKP